MWTTAHFSFFLPLLIVSRLSVLQLDALGLLLQLISSDEEDDWSLRVDFLAHMLFDAPLPSLQRSLES